MSGPVQLNLILACGLHGQIGHNGAMPWKIPEETKFFKDTTTGRPVIMGRTTFESLGKPLPNRRNIIVSSKLKYIPGAECVATLQEALAKVDGVSEAFVIGGVRLWTEALPLADLALISQVEFDEVVDTNLPESFFIDLRATYYMAAMNQREKYSVTYWKRIGSPLYTDDELV
ncbi:dihydrofolate reductase [Pseudomonas fluorescens]|uniref:dihydrofolate reductase n=1 Tax=Pseudomonas TaxID=286 RepID=UPI000F043534|nr:MULTISPECIES: dihydrofolate reductase [Pseudomonas]MBD8088630.1 dihydrofolate reductase [Pseudomonas fluorescens]MBD8681407.1 dihydrofolate reductase [Pseudomonas sp. CFBP 13719]